MKVILLKKPENFRSALAANVLFKQFQETAPEPVFFCPDHHVH